MVIIRYNRFDVRLLQHDLANPNLIGIAGISPGKISTVTDVPGQQTATEIPFCAFGDLHRMLETYPKGNAVPNEMAELHSYTCALSGDQIFRLKADLPGLGFDFCEVPHAQFAAKKNKLRIAVYQSGKLLVQGQGVRDFVEFYLEPHLLGVARLGYEEVLDPTILHSRIGVDESGKGDFFGPLVVAGVFVNESVIRAWRDGQAGIRDSKLVTTDARISALARIIRGTRHCVVEIVTIGPRAYNDLHAKMRNVNKILAWGHARVIENLLAKVNCPKVVSDQFGNKSLVERALMQRGKKIELVQRHKAESDLAVAAASILARDEFVRQLKKMGERVGIPLPKGASAAVEETGRKLVAKHGLEKLSEVAKIHFRTTDRIRG